MLKEYKSMTQEEMYTLVHEIYIEGCMENAREKYPDVTDLTTAIQQEEDSFVCFLQDFFTLPENTYYVLEKDNMPVSAARLNPSSGQSGKLGEVVLRIHFVKPPKEVNKADN